MSIGNVEARAERSEARKSKPPAKPKTTDEQIKAAHMSVRGLSHSAIGGILGKNRNTIGKWLSKPEIRDYMAELGEGASEACKDYLATEMIEMVKEIRDIVANGKNEQARVSAFKALKEMIPGFTEPQKVEETHKFELWLKSGEDLPEGWDSDLMRLPAPPHDPDVIDVEVSEVN